MSIERQLKRLFDTIVAEIRQNDAFAAKVREAVGASESGAKPRRTGRRQPGSIDPFAVYSSQQEQGLRRQLSELTVEQLKDIVAEHGMDQSKLALKWKSPDRLMDHIVERVRDRAAKGDAFRKP